MKKIKLWMVIEFAKLPQIMSEKAEIYLFLVYSLQYFFRAVPSDSGLKFPPVDIFLKGILEIYTL